MKTKSIKLSLLISYLNGKNLQYKTGKGNFSNISNFQFSKFFNLILGKAGRVRTTGESLGF